ncbi:hypothetical protein DIZ76_015735 [Coccidioides immitis]|nr:hypothetical protein DIZ76_015735 [Coccidioides immitis]
MAAIARPTSDLLKSCLSDKVVLVTGAASGIGIAVAKQWAEHGAKVILTDVDKEKLEAATQGIGSGSACYVCNVASWSEQVKLFDDIKRNHGVPDIVALNAGIDPELAKMHDLPDEERKRVGNTVLHNYLADDYSEQDQHMLKQPADDVFNVNFKGVVYGIKLAVHHMKKAKKAGRIIVVGSAASYLEFPGQDLYVASKHAVLGLVRSTSSRKDVQEAGIILSMVGPWWTKTPLVEKIRQDRKGMMPESSAEDVAWAVSYLTIASRENANGRCVWVRGSGITEVEGSYRKWLAGLIKL